MKMTTEMFIEKARAVHGDKYDYSKTVYTGARDKLTIVCRKHGAFEQQACSHLQGCGCRKCGREVFSDKLREMHATTDMAARATATKRARFGSGKAPGSGKQRFTRDEFIARAREVHGDKYDYSKVIYDGSSEKVIIICPIHGEFEQTANKHLMGRGCQHPDCIAEKKVSTSLERFGVANAMQCADVRQKLVDNNLARYGVVNPSQLPAVTAKRKATVLERYGVTCTMQADGIRERAMASRLLRFGGNGPMCSAEMRKLASETMLVRYGVEHALQSAEFRQKVYDTKKANGTFSTSRPEENLYTMLCSFFGESDVVRQFRSDRYCRDDGYKFVCDFYIKSRDMYIELNASWTHGDYWFDAGNSDDIARRDEWLVSGKAYYKDAIRTWTERDVQKRLSAQRSGLNYIVFWDNDLHDAELWLESGAPDGQDYVREYSWLPQVDD